MTAHELVAAAQQRGFAARPKVEGFPYLAEALRAAGVLRHEFLVPTATSLYTTTAGSAVLPSGRPVVTEPADVPAWNRSALLTAIEADKQGGEFPDFVAACWNAGVTRWIIDTAERTCTYVGGTEDDRYVENYPAVELP
ncbi:DUF1398 family protein [Actinospica durhamensis]|uniref:DUF1398 family protein n=1 Tax=Actinospica durhamensis TaxID=1508375 RepID=A0A941EYZ2_9ACTN|nr:DUF1398 family protein [Actinospica durhamensis]MBR7839796.1 DUF1398 family protein [Actinospica durhamensis]